jgi:hypothetical protein
MLGDPCLLIPARPPPLADLTPCFLRRAGWLKVQQQDGSAVLSLDSAERYGAARAGTGAVLRGLSLD